MHSTASDRRRHQWPKISARQRGWEDDMGRHQPEYRNWDWDRDPEEGAESLGLDCEGTQVAENDARLPRASHYARSEYDPAYQRERSQRSQRSDATRVHKRRRLGGLTVRTRILVYMLVASLLTCGGAAIGGALSLGYLQQAIPQLYTQHAPNTPDTSDTQNTPTATTSSISPVARLTPSPLHNPTLTPSLKRHVQSAAPVEPTHVPTQVEEYPY